MKCFLIVFALMLGTSPLLAQHIAYFTIKDSPIAYYRSFMVHYAELVKADPYNHLASGEYISANYPNTIWARKLRVTILDTVDGIVTIKYKGRKAYTVPEAFSTVEYNQPTLMLYKIKIGAIVATSRELMTDYLAIRSKGAESAAYFMSLHGDDIVQLENYLTGYGYGYLLDKTNGIAHITTVSDNTDADGNELYTLFKWLSPASSTEDYQ